MLAGWCQLGAVDGGGIDHVNPPGTGNRDGRIVAQRFVSGKLNPGQRSRPNRLVNKVYVLRVQVFRSNQFNRFGRTGIAHHDFGIHPDFTVFCAYDRSLGSTVFDYNPINCSLGPDNAALSADDSGKGFDNLNVAPGCPSETQG